MKNEENGNKMIKEALKQMYIGFNLNFYRPYIKDKLEVLIEDNILNICNNYSINEIKEMYDMYYDEELDLDLFNEVYNENKIKECQKYIKYSNYSEINYKEIITDINKLVIKESLDKTLKKIDINDIKKTKPTKPYYNKNRW